MIPAQAYPVGQGQFWETPSSKGADALSLLASYYEGQTARADKEADRTATMLPTLAQMGMLQPPEGMQMGGFAVGQKPADYGDLLKKQELADIQWKRDRGIDPWTDQQTTAMYRAIAKEIPWLGELNLGPEQMADIVNRISAYTPKRTSPQAKGEAIAEQKSGKRIRVKDKASGQTGTILESDFDSKLYERIK